MDTAELKHEIRQTSRRLEDAKMNAEATKGTPEYPMFAAEVDRLDAKLDELVEEMTEALR